MGRGCNAPEPVGTERREISQHLNAFGAVGGAWSPSESMSCFTNAMYDYDLRVDNRRRGSLPSHMIGDRRLGFLLAPGISSPPLPTSAPRGHPFCHPPSSPLSPPKGDDSLWQNDMVKADR